MRAPLSSGHGLSGGTDGTYGRKVVPTILVTTASSERTRVSQPPTGVTVPPVLYVPCESGSTAPGEARLTLRRTKDGRTALLAYTALDRLVACCGSDQPWVLVPTDRLDAIDDAQADDVIYLDITIPAHERVLDEQAR